MYVLQMYASIYVYINIICIYRHPGVDRIFGISKKKKGQPKHPR